MFSPLTKQLIEALRCLPGIGPKSAQRMAFQLLAASGKHKGSHLAEVLKQAVEKVDYCQRCRIYSETLLCELCANPKRDAALLCVLEAPADVIAIEQTHSYRGLYFVLHGHLSPLDGIGPKEIGIPQLMERVKEAPVTELIIATNPTAEGKVTAHYIATQAASPQLRISRIAHGVPIGGELEYLDSGTLSHAFLSRRLIED